MTQGTVRRYDPATGSGEVLLDDGHDVAFDGAALDRDRVRLLRPGQRVALVLDRDSRRARYVTLATLPVPPGAGS